MRKSIVLCQLLGWLLFLVAFLLPAVVIDKSTYDRVGPIGWPSAGYTITNSDAPHPEAFRGWECARIALTAPLGADHNAGNVLPQMLMFLSGLLNLFIALYLIFSVFQSRWLARRILVFAVSLSLFATWILFAMVHYYPLIGHYLWAMGALLILSPEIFRMASKSAS